VKNNFDDILDKAYNNFLNKTVIPLSKEDFIQKVKTDNEFPKNGKPK
jgi:hypothetical protein